MRRLILTLLFLPLPALARSNDEAKALIAHQCAACHEVPGVVGAVGRVGPSLNGIGRQQIIAGKLANNPANMVRWLMHPQQIYPGVAMPEMGLTQDQARKIADYLYTLDRR